MSKNTTRSAIVISLCLLIYLLWKVDFENIAIKNPNWYDLPVILISTSGAYLFRAFFYKRSAQATNIRVRDFVAVTGIFNFISSIFPFGIGNLSYPVLLKKYYGLGLEYGASSLLIYIFARIVILVIGLTIAVLLLGVFRRFVEIYIAIVACAAVSFCLLFVFFDRIEKLSVPLRHRILASFFKKTMAVKQEIMKLANHTQLLWLFILASVVCVFNVISIWFTFHFMGYSIPILGIVYIWSASNLGSLLPIHGIAGFGSYEAINTLILLSLGLSTNEAIQMSFVVHILSLFVQGLLALCSWLFISKFSEDISNSNTPVCPINDCER